MLKSESLFLLSIIVLLNSCSAVKAPRGSVPKRNALMTDAYGGWVELRLNSPKDSIAGEFIAAENDSLYVMTSGKVQKYAIANISSARVILFTTESGAFAAWTFLGGLLSISNGGFLIFTLPLTLITGIATTVSEAKRINFVDYPSNNFEALIKYARFPQGIPKGINTAELKPRLNLKH